MSSARVQRYRHQQGAGLSECADPRTPVPSSRTVPPPPYTGRRAFPNWQKLINRESNWHVFDK